MPRRGRPGLVGTMARTAVVAGTATMVVGAVSGSKQSKANRPRSATSQAAQAQTQAQMAEMQAQLDQMNAEKAAAAQQAAIDKAVADAVEQQPAAAAAPRLRHRSGTGDDAMAQLQQLGDMKAQGLLSDEEFAAMKTKLLAGGDRWSAR